MTRPLLLATMLVALSSAVLGASPVRAASAEAQMMKLDPAERVEQVCNTKAMGEVQRAAKGMRPDELVAYAYANTKLVKGRFAAPGAAVRSAGTWYHLSYTCETDKDGLNVKSFTYKLGAAIPRSEWDAHYLVAQ